jgi:hypothetical protein
VGSARRNRDVVIIESVLNDVVVVNATSLHVVEDIEVVKDDGAMEGELLTRSEST